MARSLIKLNFSLHQDKASIEADAGLHQCGRINRLVCTVGSYSVLFWCTKHGQNRSTQLHHPSEGWALGFWRQMKNRTFVFLLLKPPALLSSGRYAGLVEQTHFCWRGLRVGARAWAQTDERFSALLVTTALPGLHFDGCTPSSAPASSGLILLCRFWSGEHHHLAP